MKKRTIGLLTMIGLATVSVGATIPAVVSCAGDTNVNNPNNNTNNSSNNNNNSNNNNGNSNNNNGTNNTSWNPQYYYSVNNNPNVPVEMQTNDTINLGESNTLNFKKNSFDINEFSNFFTTYNAVNQHPLTEVKAAANFFSPIDLMFGYDSKYETIDNKQCTISDNVDFLYQFKNILFNNSNEFKSSLDIAYVGAHIPKDVDPAHPSLILQVGFKNNKVISTRLTGFDSASLKDNYQNYLDYIAEKLTSVSLYKSFDIYSATPYWYTGYGIPHVKVNDLKNATSDEIYNNWFAYFNNQIMNVINYYLNLDFNFNFLVTDDQKITNLKDQLLFTINKGSVYVDYDDKGYLPNNTDEEKQEDLVYVSFKDKNNKPIGKPQLLLVRPIDNSYKSVSDTDLLNKVVDWFNVSYQRDISSNHPNFKDIKIGLTKEQWNDPKAIDTQIKYQSICFEILYKSFYLITT